IADRRMMPVVYSRSPFAAVNVLVTAVVPVPGENVSSVTTVVRPRWASWQVPVWWNFTGPVGPNSVTTVSTSHRPFQGRSTAAPAAREARSSAGRDVAVGASAHPARAVRAAKLRGSRAVGVVGARIGSPGRDDCESGKRINGV